MFNLKIDRFRKHLASGAVAIGVMTGVNLFSSPVEAQTFICSGLGDCPSVPLSDLLVPNTSYQVGDKLFDNFHTFISNGTNNGIFQPGLAPTSSEIFVTGTQTNPTWFNLHFTTSEWSVNAAEAMDTAFQYDVTSLDTPITLVDLDLVAHGANGNAEISVAETVTLLDPGGLTVDLLAQSIPPGPVFDIQPLIPPQQKISIAKDVALRANGGSAEITHLKQSYHQGTPESSSIIGLLVFSGLGLTIIRKRKKINKA